MANNGKQETFSLESQITIPSPTFDDNDTDGATTTKSKVERIEKGSLY